jgi:hypothetical protein
VLPLGDTTVTWSATDAAHNTGTATQTVHVVDTTRPTITCPANVNGIVGQSVTLVTATATDIVDATPTIANNAPATFGPGGTTVHWTATDDSSNVARCDQKVTLIYRWSGFLSPVSNTTTNKVNAGATIVFKWTLKDFSNAYVKSLNVVTNKSFSGLKPPDATYSLKYDPVANQYVLNAKTPTGWKGSTRTFTLTLNDGTTHTATFKFA